MLELMPTLRTGQSRNAAGAPCRLGRLCFPPRSAGRAELTKLARNAGQHVGKTKWPRDGMPPHPPYFRSTGRKDLCEAK